MPELPIENKFQATLCKFAEGTVHMKAHTILGKCHLYFNTWLRGMHKYAPLKVPATYNIPYLALSLIVHGFYITHMVHCVAPLHLYSACTLRIYTYKQVHVHVCSIMS